MTAVSVEIGAAYHKQKSNCLLPIQQLTNHSAPMQTVKLGLTNYQAFKKLTYDPEIPSLCSVSGAIIELNNTLIGAGVTLADM